MNRSIFFAAMLLASACSRQQVGPEPANETANAGDVATAAMDVPALAGEWQVQAIDGKPLDAGSAIIATFSDSKLQLASGCLLRAWTYTQKRNMVAFKADPARSSNCGAPPSAAQENAYAALDLVTMAVFANNGAEATLSGNGGTLTLLRR